MSSPDAQSQPPRRKRALVPAWVWYWLCVAVVCAAVLSGRPLLLWMSLAIWLVAFLTHVHRWGLFLRNLKGLHRLTRASNDGEGDETLPGVSVIVPARDEEAGIEVAARSLAVLDYPNLEIIILNDHSTDATPRILDRLAAEFPRLRVVHDPPYQEGWLGKANTLWQGTQLANPDNPYLLFTDADVIHDPKSLRRAMAYALRSDFDYLTCVPWLANGTIWEELTLSAGWCGIIVSALYDRINDPRTTPIGVGPFALAKRTSYFASGGHSAIYNRAPEDKSLAETIKQWGGNMGVVWTNELLQFRLYRGYRQLRNFLVRKIRIKCANRISLFAFAIAQTLVADVLPLPLALAGAARQAWSGGRLSVPLSLFCLLAFLTYAARAGCFRAFRQVAYMRPGVPWLHPLGGILHCWFSLLAVWQILFRKRIEWRGRQVTKFREPHST